MVCCLGSMAVASSSFLDLSSTLPASISGKIKGPLSSMGTHWTSHLLTPAGLFGVFMLDVLAWRFLAEQRAMRGCLNKGWGIEVG